MHKKEICYWLTTGIFCVIFTVAGIANLIQVEPQKEVIQGLGYPVYLMTILGIAKTLGVITLLLPKTPRLKEWAYAGFAFDMIGAAMSHILAGDSVESVVPPIVIGGIDTVSYLLRPEVRRL